jgi:hypothetical protein
VHGNADRLRAQRRQSRSARPALGLKPWEQNTLLAAREERERSNVCGTAEATCLSVPV